MNNIIMLLNFNETETNLISDRARANGFYFSAKSVITDVGLLETPASSNLLVLLALVNANGMSEASLDQLIQVLTKKRIPCDVFADEKTKNSILAKVGKEPVAPIRFHQSNLAEFSNELDQIFGFLFPVGLKELCRDATAFIGKNIFPNIEFNLKDRDANDFKGDFIVYCEVIDKALFGAVTIKVDSARLKSINEFYNGLSQELILDSLKEFLNQLLGAINFNLVRYLKVNPSVSLPLAFVNSKNQMSRPLGVSFKPSYTCREATGAMEFRYEFMSIDPQVDIRSLGAQSMKFEPPGEAAEFF